MATTLYTASGIEVEAESVGHPVARHLGLDPQNSTFYLATWQDDAAGAVNHNLIPKMVVVAEPLSVGVIGSGIGLASLLGYWAAPSIWLWGALAVGLLMLVIGFGPLHIVTTGMVVELAKDEPDGERLEALFGNAMQWGLLQTVFMLAIIVMMVGLRGLL